VGLIFLKFVRRTQMHFVEAKWILSSSNGMNMR